MSGILNNPKQWYEIYVTNLEKQSTLIQKIEESEDGNKQRLLSLDTSLKKTTAFSNKLKHLSGSSTIDSLTSELDKVNVSKFLEEIVDATLNCKLKVVDIPSMITFCGKATIYYKQFSNLLLEGMKNHFPNKKNIEIKDTRKLRVDLQLLLELILYGIFGKEGISLFGNVFAFLLTTDSVNFNNISIIMPLLKIHILAITSLAPKKITEAGIIIEKRTNVFNDDQRKLMTKYLLNYYETFYNYMNSMRIELLKSEKNIKRLEKTRGDCSIEERNCYENKKEIFLSKLPILTEFASIIGEDLNDEITHYEVDDDIEETELQFSCEINSTKMSLWKDPDLKIFYENLLDPRQSMGNVTALESDSSEKKLELETEIDSIELENVDGEVSIIDNEEMTNIVEESIDDDDVEEKIAKMTMCEDEENEKGEKINFGEFLRNLMKALNKSLIDECSLKYLGNFNKKNYNKRLHSFILQIPLERNDVLPFIGRFLANIKSYNEGLIENILSVLIGEFFGKPYSIKEDKNAYLRMLRRIQHAKLISEFVKFQIIPKAQILSLLRRTIVDFRGYNIDICASILETCGGFLYRCADSHSKTYTIIELCKKKIENLKDERFKAVIQNAIFNVLPESEISILQKPRAKPTILGFIHHCFSIYIDNGKNYFKDMDINDSEFREPLLKFLRSPENVAYDDAHYLASILYDISSTAENEWVAINVVDFIIEKIDQILERNDIIHKQDLLIYINYAGDLFSYVLLSKQSLLQILYKLVPFYLIKKPVQWDMTCLRIQLAASLAIGVIKSFYKREDNLKMKIFSEYLFLIVGEAKMLYKEEFDDEFPWQLRHTLKDFNSTVRKNGNINDSIEEIKLKYEKMVKKYDNLYAKSNKKKVDVMNGIKEENNEEEYNEESENDSDRERDEIDRDESLSQNINESEDYLSEDEESEEEDNDVFEEEDYVGYDEEDEAFNACLDACLTIENVCEVQEPLFKPNNLEFSIPSSARHKLERMNKGGILSPKEQTNDFFKCTKPIESPSCNKFEQPPVVTFLTKGKGNKPILKNVSVSEDKFTKLQQRIIVHKEQDILQRKQNKFVTLRLNQEQEEEQYDEEDN
uniref:MIF4G domain-containing protein n=1 Tax=Parastrongyloides trichosuri TaxID=131310 RepID=A0A0N4ZPP6_PARTI